MMLGHGERNVNGTLCLRDAVAAVVVGSAMTLSMAELRQHGEPPLDDDPTLESANRSNVRIASLPPSAKRSRPFRTRRIAEFAETVAVFAPRDRVESSKVRPRPWGHWGSQGGTVQVPPTRDGDPPSLSGVMTLL
jgi:hypothetical protein